MKDGFIKVAAACPKIRVADTVYNTDSIISLYNKSADLGVKLTVFPELSITGRTAGDLFYTETLVSSVITGINRIRAATELSGSVAVVGAPISVCGKLYNTAVVISRGEILGVVPRSIMTGEEDGRWFTDGDEAHLFAEVCGETVPFGTNLIFRMSELGEFSFAIDVGANGRNHPWLSECGAIMTAGLGGNCYLAGNAKKVREGINALTSRYVSGYIYTSPGEGESTTDGSYAGHTVISEKGKVLSESRPFSGEELTVTELDVRTLSELRRRDRSFRQINDEGREIIFDLPIEKTTLTRVYSKSPFIPDNLDEMEERFGEIIAIASNGLKKRLHHVSAKGAVVAVSGGLDSTLALLVTVRAVDLLGLDRKSIIAVSMPGFGTTARTKSNAEKLCDALGVSYREIPISEAVKIHFRDIGHSEDIHDVTYENSQARERTQIVMDLANKEGAILVGTGDLSELALGWATYNGDHMSMYGVNGGIPKTLMRHIVSFCADKGGEVLGDILRDILDTPVSPELLPAENGEISQCTENIVGPYRLHDFFIYHFLRYGTAPKKLFRIAMHTFKDEYSAAEILKWQRNFTWRFFAQQFKRSCLPDGPMIGSICLSPRGALRMPSDALSTVWIKEIEEIEKTL
ncbi:MAG: NAD(+) synthase [Clostridia bacterium]|nr:NAD(+) synthase [Clostridia bacterium]